MKITKVAPAVKTPGRYNVYVDGKYSFSLDELQLIQSGIRSGQDIDEAQLAALQNESSFGKNYIRAIDLISRRPRSEKEIRDYAFRKQWTPDNTERVIKRLYDKSYLNDRNFAEMFVRSRTSIGKYSKKRIELDLRKKGIKTDIIHQVLNAEISDNDALMRLIQKRINRYDDDNKLKAYLLRNGFGYDDINRALAEYRNQVND